MYFVFLNVGRCLLLWVVIFKSVVWVGLGLGVGLAFFVGGLLGE
jgi:hypothetical protein